MRYTNTPRYGMKITKIDHSALPPPERSRLRKMSPNTEMRSQIQMKNRKNHSIDQNTCPVPNSASIAFSFFREWKRFASDATFRRVSGEGHHPGWVNGRRHGPVAASDHPSRVATATRTGMTMALQ